MSLQHPVSDMITRIRNAQAVHKQDVRMPFSKLKLAIAEVLKQEGYVSDCKKIEQDGKDSLQVDLKYHQGLPVITKISVANRPSLPVYKGTSELPKVKDGLGVAIVSTSKGLMTDRMARAQGHGGTILCYVY